MEHTNQIFPEVRNKNWERTEMEKLLKYYKLELGQTREETKKYQTVTNFENMGETINGGGDQTLQ